MMGLPEMIRPNTELVNDGALKLLTYQAGIGYLGRVTAICDGTM